MFERLRRLITSPETKASWTGRVIALQGGGRSRWTPRDYVALAREGYAKNAIVYRAVRLVAESIGSLSFVLYEGAAERDKREICFSDLVVCDKRRTTQAVRAAITIMVWS